MSRFRKDFQILLFFQLFQIQFFFFRKIRWLMYRLLQQIKEGVRPAIKSCFQCLEHCDIRTIPYCITQALVNAVEGDENNALLFCGSNAYRAEKIEKVDDVMKELVGE